MYRAWAKTCVADANEATDIASAKRSLHQAVALLKKALVYAPSQKSIRSATNELERIKQQLAELSSAPRAKETQRDQVVRQLTDAATTTTSSSSDSWSSTAHRQRFWAIIVCILIAIMYQWLSSR
jgi:septal ring factor EnvC (AmiA/AmiB activator)